MKKFFFLAFLTFVPTIFCNENANSWGFWAHKQINKLAIYTLDGPLLKFFKQNAEYIEAHAVDADKRRYIVEGEAPKHYIDLDHYSSPEEIAGYKTWFDAVRHYGKDSLNAHGIVPWQVQHSFYQLVDAFIAKDKARILKVAANLGHYVADASVPLHATSNYNGQKTNQKGIHGLWETNIPELSGSVFDPLTGPASVYKDVAAASWALVLESGALVDSVLSIEAKLNTEFPSDQKYSLKKKGKKNVSTYSDAYVQAYHERLNGMVERRYRRAILALGCFWTTAYKMAGKPDIKEFVVKQEEKEEVKPVTSPVKEHE